MEKWISILCATAFLVVSGASSAENAFDVNKIESQAKQGDAVAQFNLGWMYHEGQGLRQDFVQAKEWFGKACDSGKQDGCDSYRKLNEASIR